MYPDAIHLFMVYVSGIDMNRTV